MHFAGSLGAKTLKKSLKLLCIDCRRELEFMRESLPAIVDDDGDDWLCTVYALMMLVVQP